MIPMTTNFVEVFSSNSERRSLTRAVFLSGLLASMCATSIEAQICGDANGNGLVTVTDSVQTLRAAAGLSSVCSLSVCDIDGSGTITVTDSVNVLRVAIGLPVSLACVTNERFVDNGDGTVTDYQAGLMWEKKTTAVGSGTNYADPHDVDNRYSWSVGGTNNPPDGTAFTDFLVKLNTPPCFAGHCDWRLPSEDGIFSPFTGAKELESILLVPFPCGTTPCIDPIFGPTVAGVYWSATTFAFDPRLAFLVLFDEGDLGNAHKVSSFYVRAVRTGS